MNILVIDDEHCIGDLLCRVLRPFHKVRAVQEPQCGVDLLQQETFHLLFLDAKLNGSDGFEVLQLIKTFQPDLPVIMMSGFLDFQLRERAEREAQAFLQKPFHIELVRNLVNQTLCNHAPED